MNIRNSIQFSGCTRISIDGSHLGPGYYELLPDWMQLVEERAQARSGATFLAWIYALALATEPNDVIIRISIERWIARYYRAFRREEKIAVEWIRAGQSELVALGQIQVRGDSVELTWPATHQLYAIEPAGTA